MSKDQITKILIVDDEPTCRRVLELAFKTSNIGYDISLASNSREAINIVENDKPDLIITDLHLGDEDSGFEICKAIKENNNFNHIPIISVSALEKRDAKPKQYSDIADSDLHFNKPFDVMELTDIVKNLLKPIVT